ncbi:MAG TPA: ankyrin repeat domain-containing protein [archaeon]|nr:ankyrin repeat domain-containing protein [archaeon]
MILERLGIYVWNERDENLLLAGILTGDPLLLIGTHGAAKTHLATKFAGALTLAVNRESLQMVKFLVAAGVEVNSVNNWGETALMNAAGRDNPEIVKTLLAAGATVNVVSNYGGTALMRAAEKGRLETVKLLLASGG